MRMRKKRNLEERMERCAGYLIEVERSEQNSLLAAKEPHYIDFAEMFGNNAPVHLEIGCGKGRFACEYAMQHGDINVLAVEKSRNVLISGCEEAMRLGIPNLRFVHAGAEYLRSFLPDSSVERIFLNFSCPFPKAHNANRRLTNHSFLEIYRHILTPDGQIHQKTDNMQLFEYSIEQFSQCGYLLRNISLDLHNSGFEGNIVTEYEAKFAALGYPIYRLEAYIK